jgi:spermidine synthase/uncharacterized membrane protein YhaH (DUF805 family)
VISLVMLSLAAPGAILYAFPRLSDASRSQQQVAGWCVGFGVLLFNITVLYLALNLPVMSPEHNWWLRPDGKRHVMIIFALWMVPFLAGGFVPALLLARHPEQSARLYAWDLGGAALGGAAYVVLLNLVSGVTALLLVSAFFVFCAIFFLPPGDRRRTAMLSVLGLAMCAVAAGNAALMPGAPVRIRYAKYYEEPIPVLERWTPISRITVHRPGEVSPYRPDTGFGWGLSPKYKRTDGRQPEELWIEQDASAGTPITRWDGHTTQGVQHLLHDVTAFLYRLHTPRDIYIVGAGGGRDVLTALLAGVKDVTAVEMNPATVHLLRDEITTFTGGLYRDPRVTMVVGEGRNVLQASGRRFDAIQVSLIDSFAATAAGAFVFVENMLYTREALESYLDHLTPDGVLTLSWWYMGKPPGVAYRLFSGAAEALASRGAKDPPAHILAIKSGLLFNYLVKRSPWTPQELARARAESAAMGFEVLFEPPNLSPDPNLPRLLANPGEMRRASNLNLVPATDDKPFYLQLQKWGEDYSNIAPENLPFLAGTRILQALMLLMGGAGFVLVILPLMIRAGRRRTAGPRTPVWAPLLVAAGCGMGYILVEITLMHYGTLMVGYPVYSLLLVLVALLLGSGVGSGLTARREAGPLAARVALAMAVLAVLLPAIAVAGRWAHDAGAAWPWAVRALVLCGASFGLGLLMGMPFPTLMRLAGAWPGADNAGGGLLPWLWGVNGVAGVLASVLVMVIAVHLGHFAAMLCGAGCYAVVALGMALVSRRWNAASADGISRD